MFPNSIQNLVNSGHIFTTTPASWMRIFFCWRISLGFVRILFGGLSGLVFHRIGAEQSAVFFCPNCSLWQAKPLQNDLFKVSPFLPVCFHSDFLIFASDTRDQIRSQLKSLNPDSQNDSEPVTPIQGPRFKAPDPWARSSPDQHHEPTSVLP